MIAPTLPAALLAAALLCAHGPAPALELHGAGANYRLDVASVKALRFRTTIRQQYDFSCGSAALATLLTHHFGYRVTEQQVFEEMYARGDQPKIRREGFSLLDMKRYLAARGYRADGFQLPLEKLLEADVPAIVLVVENGYHHFVVVKGLRDGRVLLGDPASGTRALARAAFERLWPSRLLFVIHGRTTPGQALFNDGADWRTAPRMALGDAVPRDSLGDVTLLKHGSNAY